MKILITGGCGFVGANLARYFRKKGHTVVAFDNLVRRGAEMNLLDFKKLGIQFIHGDVRCSEDFVTLPKDVDVLCECSAQPSAIDGYANPTFDITNNTIGVLNCLEYCRRIGSAIIMWSTNKTYSGEKINAFPIREEGSRWVWDAEKIRKSGIRVPEGFDPVHGFSSAFNPDGGQHSIYGLSKIMADLMCQEWFDAYKVKTVINRFSCLAGEGQFGKCAQGWVAWWAVAAHFKLPLTYIGWKGKQVRDVLFVGDICRLVEMEIEQIDKVAGKAFNVGGGKDITLSLVEATSLMEKKFKTKMKTILDKKPRKADHCIYISDIRPITEAIGWKPKLGIEEGYDRIIRWVRDSADQLKYLYL